MTLAIDMHRLTLLTLFGLFVGLWAARAQTCPNCFDTDQVTPFGGHGAAPDGSGRRVINVCFDSSMQVNNNGTATPGQTNVTGWNALYGWNDSSGHHMGAMEAWNTATDQYGNKTGYYVTYNCSQPDITIGYSTDVDGGCAQNTSSTSGPNNAMINGPTLVSAATLQTGAPAVVYAFSHEIGHNLGLQDNSVCGNTIMGGQTQCVPQYYSAAAYNSGTNPVQSGDVTAANSFLNGSSSCTVPWDIDQQLGSCDGDPDCSCDDPCDPNCTDVYDPSSCDGGCDGYGCTGCGTTGFDGLGCDGCDGSGCDGWGCDGGGGCDGGCSCNVNTDCTFIVRPILPVATKSSFAFMLGGIFLIPAAFRLRRIKHVESSSQDYLSDNA